MEILSLFSKEEGFGRHKNLSLKHNERKEKIKTLYEQNPGNEFLLELMGIPKTDHNTTDSEINIKHLTENDLIQSYYGMLLDLSSTQKEVAQIAGLNSESSVCNRKEKYKIEEKGYPYTLKAYKRHKN